MTSQEFYVLIKQDFPFAPTQTQSELLLHLSQFIFDKSKNQLFLLLLHKKF